MIIRASEKTILAEIAFVISLCVTACISCTALEFSQNHLPYANLDNEAAVKEIHQRLKKYPENISLRYQLVEILLEELFFDDAIAELRQIIHIDRYDASAYQLLSILLYKKPYGDLEQAFSTLKDGLVVMPTNAGLHANLAVLFVESGQLDLHELCQTCASGDRQLSTEVVFTSGTTGKTLSLYVDMSDIIMGLFGYIRALREFGINW